MKYFPSIFFIKYRVNDSMVIIIMDIFETIFESLPYIIEDYNKNKMIEILSKLLAIVKKAFLPEKSLNSSNEECDHINKILSILRLCVIIENFIDIKKNAAVIAKLKSICAIIESINSKIFSSNPIWKTLKFMINSILNNNERQRVSQCNPKIQTTVFNNKNFDILYDSHHERLNFTMNDKLITLVELPAENKDRKSVV